VLRRLALVLVGLLLVGVCVPIVGDFLREIGTMVHAGGSIPMLLWAGSIGYALAGGAIAGLLALAVAIGARRAGVLLTSLVLLPVIVPIYLVPSAWRTVLDPSSAIGMWIARHAQDSPVDLVLLSDRVIAIVGLGIWASPLAWLVIHARVRAIGSDVLDALALGGGSRLRRARTLLAMVRGGLLRGWLLASLILLAQSVPFDLAQMDSAGGRVREAISLNQHDRAWIIALPGIVLALLVGVWASRLPRRHRTVSARPQSERTRSRDVLVVLAYIALGVVVPIVLLTLSLRDPSAIVRFLRRSGGALMATGLNAGVVALLGGLLGASITILDDGRGGRFVRVVTGVFAALALVPGTLIGSSIVSATRWVPAWLGDSPAGLWIAHLARFGVVACLVGLWVRAIEPTEIRDALRLEGSGARVWFLGELPRYLPAILGGGLVMGILSMHEIEASVLLQPVGTDALSRFLLELLHYQRRDDLAAGVLVIVAITLVMGTLAGILLTTTQRVKRRA